MTRKEAIEILKELWRYEKSDKYIEDEIRNALGLAIASLETDEAYQLEYENKNTTEWNTMKEFIEWVKNTQGIELNTDCTVKHNNIKEYKEPTTDPLTQSVVDFCRKTVEDYEKKHNKEEANDD